MTPIVVASIFLTMPHSAFAEEQADQHIDVVASISDPADDSTTGSRSILRHDLEAQAPVSLLESLPLLPGIDAFEKGGSGGGSYLSLRGGEPNFTLVTINGVRVNDPMLSSGGGFDFSLLGPSDAARIDVISGASSTAYGADALSGIVSIRIDPPTSNSGVSAQAGVGSGGRYQSSGRMVLSGKAGTLGLNASARDTNDYQAGSTSDGQSIMLSASPNLSGMTLDLFGMYAQSDSTGFPEDSGGPELAEIRNPESRRRRQAVLGVTASTRLSGNLVSQFHAGWNRSVNSSSSPGIAPGALDGVPPIDSESRFTRLEGTASLEWTLSPTVIASLGASIVQEQGASTGTIDYGAPIPTDYRLSRTLPGVYATAAVELPGAAELRAGVRADFPESGAARVSPRVGVAIPVASSGVRIRANYAMGFKQPSLYALGYPLIANPELLPERSESYDAGIEWRSKDGAWYASATAVRSVYRDMIDFDPDLFTNVNRDRVTAEGFEFAASGVAGPVRIISSLTYLDTRSADGAQLRYRPKWKGAAAVEWNLAEQIQLRADGRFNGSFHDSSVPTGFQKLDGFATIDAQITIALNPTLDLTGALRNLTDERYYGTIGTPEPGRNVFISLSGRL